MNRAGLNHALSTLRRLSAPDGAVHSAIVKLSAIGLIGLALAAAIVVLLAIRPEPGLKPGTITSPEPGGLWYREVPTLPQLRSEDYLAHHRYDPNALKAQSLFVYEDILFGRVRESEARKTNLIDEFVDENSRCFVEPAYLPIGFFLVAAAIAGECDGILFYVSFNTQIVGQDQATLRVVSYEDVRPLVEVASYEHIQLPIAALIIQGNLVPDVYTPFPWSETRQPRSVARSDRQTSKSVVFQKGGRTVVVTGYQPRLWFGEYASPYWTDKEVATIATSIRACCQKKTRTVGAEKS